MSDTFQCGDNTALVSYLYDECEPAERTAIAAHVTLCAACAAELATLESARLQLVAACLIFAAGLWFCVVRGSTPGAAPVVAPTAAVAPQGISEAQMLDCLMRVSEQR